MDDAWMPDPHGPRAPDQAVDATDASRPGVPEERLHAPAPAVSLVDSEPQGDTAALESSGVRKRTTVFGTAQPARLASGALRRVAYRIPEQRASRWVLLLFADRVDVMEHRLGRGLWLVPALGALGAGYALASRVLRRR